MGFDRSFTAGLIGWIAALIAAGAALIASLLTPGLGAARIVAFAITAAAAGGLWRHVTRTNRVIAGFVDALRFSDTALRFDAPIGAGFDRLGAALNLSMSRVRARQNQISAELRYLEALIDDVPVAALTIDSSGIIAPVNKEARRLFGTACTAAEDYTPFGATFAKRLEADSGVDELLVITIDGRSQRVLVRSTFLERLGRQTRVVTVQPMGGTLQAVEMSAQVDLVRVLTHEILNSLTPVTSLAATADELLAEVETTDARIRDARVAVATLARRATGLGKFVEAYRAVARSPELKRTLFAARPWAEELVRLVAADTRELSTTVQIVPDHLVIDGDPDLLAQVLINLLRNGIQATHEGTSPPVLTLRIFNDQQETVIEVEDNGPGVPMTLRHDVFLPFFTTRSAGTGIGLNLARQIVVAHGGTIDVTDAPEGGALFRILL